MTVTVPSRCNGPPRSGNGGYTAGLIASASLGATAGAGPATVTLRSPPPLDTPLAVRPAAEGIRVYADDTLVAEAALGGRAGDPPPPVAYQTAMDATAGYAGWVDHPFPTCFVCGPERPAGDGLRIFAGPLPDGRTAAGWSVPADVSVPMMWAALDCPGGWGIIGGGEVPADPTTGGAAGRNRPYVLGRITGQVDAVPAPGERCVVVGTVLAARGRKAQVRTALYGPVGALLARADAIWIAI